MSISITDTTDGSFTSMNWTQTKKMHNQVIRELKKMNESYNAAIVFAHKDDAAGEGWQFALVHEEKDAKKLIRYVPAVGVVGIGFNKKMIRGIPAAGSSVRMRTPVRWFAGAKRVFSQYKTHVVVQALETLPITRWKFPKQLAQQPKRRAA